MVVAIRGKYVWWTLATVIVLELCLTAYLCLPLFQKQNVVDFTVVIDAGHGGIDGGVVCGNIREADLNLQYAKKLGEQFELCGFNVVYTRKSANGLYGLPTRGFKGRDMQKRKEIISSARPNLVLSIHMNKFSSQSRSGPQVFFQKDDRESGLLAQSLQNVFNDMTGNTHRALSGDFFVCRESPCPSVIVECGFLSNAVDAEKLQTEEYRKEICDKIFQGVMLFLYSAEG